ncbi:MAG: GNAT family N-acetyltransferase [Phycisphaeraceae bacterium]|nr:GNAT family N-acetyltransferase [Phycisphaeraceae bacterium]
MPPSSPLLGRASLVSIRHPIESDRREFIALRRASRAFLQPWEPIPPRGVDTWGDAAFDRDLELAGTDRSERMLIIRREDSAIVGRISLGEIIRGPLQQAFMGYWIGERFAGRGYMTQGIGLALRHAFGHLKLHRIEANIQPHNQPSRAVARASGFRLEGFSPKYLKIRGRWADHERWAITIEQWRARRAKERGRTA